MQQISQISQGKGRINPEKSAENCLSELDTYEERLMRSDLPALMYICSQSQRPRAPLLMSESCLPD